MAAAAYLENRQGGDYPKRAHLITLRVPGCNGVTGAQCAAGCLQKKSEGVLADGIFDN